MEKKQKLYKPLDFTVFKTIIIVFLLLLQGCWQRNPEFENQLWINNSTTDTLLFQVTKKYISDLPGDDMRLIPGLNRLGEHDQFSVKELIKREWKYRGDTIEIVRKGYQTIKWAAPLREMPDSVHHFFNETSWEVKMGGHKEEWEIATFTLTDEDFKPE